MNQNELESILGAAIEPVADLLATLERRLDAVTPTAVQAAKESLQLAIADALLECRRAQSSLEESAHRNDRAVDVVRAEISEALLRIERMQSVLRDGRDGVGIRAISVGADAQTLTFEFTDDTRVECLLPRGPQGDPGAAGIGIDAPPWQRGVHRKGSVVAHFEGRTYVALEDTAEEPGDSAAWGRIGRLGFRWCGPFQEGRTYEAGDFYVRGGTFQVLSTGEHRCLAPKPLSPSEVRTICANQWSEREAELRAELGAARAELNRTRDVLEATQVELKALAQLVRTHADVAQLLRRDLDAVITLAAQLRSVAEASP